jgi:hypothetical protein
MRQKDVFFVCGQYFSEESGVKYGNFFHSIVVLRNQTFANNMVDVPCSYGLKAPF